MITAVVDSSIALIDINTGSMLPNEKIKQVLTNLFLQLGEKQPALIPIKKYVERKRKCSIGISNVGDKKHVCPTFNFMPITALQCEFTSALKGSGICFMELSKTQQKSLRTIGEEDHGEEDHVGETPLSAIAKVSTLKIGTVGSRLTNRDMSYELHIESMPTDVILKALRPAIRIINQNKNNNVRSSGYVLTCKEEVEQFMIACGMEKTFLKAVAYVEAYQERNNLKDHYDGERIDDLSQTYIHEVSLV